MDDSSSQPGRTPAYFRNLFAHSGFWSSCGFDGLSLVFDVPLEAVQSLPEGQKRALMGLLHELAEGTDERLQREIAELETLAATDRFANLVKLSTRFAA